MYFMCMCFDCMYICVPYAHRSQKKVMAFLELQLHMVVCAMPCGYRKLNWGFQSFQLITQGNVDSSYYLVKDASLKNT